MTTNRTNRQGSAETAGRSLRRIAVGCFALVAGIAFLALLLWPLDQWRVAAFGPDYVPMAPSTALLFLALAGAAWLSQRQTDSTTVNRFAFLAGLGVLAISSLLGCQFLFDFQLPVEQWLTRTTETVGQIPVGRMSPLTAAVFLLASLAFLLEFPRGFRRRSLRQTAALLSLAVLFISGGVALSYGLHEPLLYGGTVVPMAALTAAAFVLISLGLLLAVGNDIWPLNLFVLSAPDAPSVRRITWGLIALALLFTATISTSAWMYFKRQQAEARRTAQETLAAIANLKTDEISGWMKEQRSNAEVSLINPTTRQFLTGSDTTAQREELLQWMATFQRVYEYSTVALFDERGTVLLAAPPDGTRPYTDIAGRVQAASRSRVVVFTDLHRAGPNQPIHMSFLVPTDLYPQAGQPGNKFLLLVVDPRRFLYPLVQNWPTPSRTAETLLVQREGNEVVFLNDVRHRTDTALTLRLPISDSTLPATMAVNGEEGVVEGLDYRGIPVLAALRKIPGTPWFMVAKVDQEEIYAPLHQQARAISLITSLLLLASMMGVGLLWRQQQQDADRRELVGRRSSEAELLQSEKKLRLLFQNLNSGIVVHTPDTRIQMANETASRLLGLSIDQLTGKVANDPTWSFVREDGTTMPFEEYPVNRVAADKQPIHNLTLGINPSSSATKYWILINAYPEFDAQGEMLQIVVTFVDITERKQAQEALRVNEEKLRLIIDTSPIGICTVDPLGNFVLTNLAYEQMLGYSKEELRGLSFFEVTHPEDRPENKERFQSMFSLTSAGFYMEKRYVRKDGTTIEVAVSATGIIDATGHATFGTAFVIDITERKKSAESIRESEERFRLLMDAITAVVWVTDDTGQFVEPQVKWEAYTGQPWEKHRGWGWTEAVHPDDRERVGALWQEAVSEVKPYEANGRIWHAATNDYHYFEVNAVHRRNPDGSVREWIGTVVDINDRKRAEAMLEQNARKLQENNMEMERFLYTVSHDLKSPVVTVRTFLGYLEQDLATADAGRIEKDMRFMRAAADKIALQLDEVLEMSRIGRIAGPSVRIAWRELVDETLAGVAGAIAERGVQVQVADSSLSLEGDRIRLVEIWQNLVENAVKFMGDQPAPRIEIGVETRGTEPVFFVRDNGIGIDPRFQAKIFGLFDKLDAKAEGSGMGLAIVQRIVTTLYGGRIWVESEGPGQGTCFHFTLPGAIEKEKETA